MPILLNDIAKSMENVKTYTPKFFHEDLTGTGKKVGILSEDKNPKHVKPERKTFTENITLNKRTVKNGKVRELYIPLNILPAAQWNYMTKKKADVSSMVKIATGDTNKTLAVYMSMQANGLILKSNEDKKELLASYQIFLYKKDPADTNEVFTLCGDIPMYQNSNRNEYNFLFTENPKEAAGLAVEMLENLRYDVDTDAVADFIKNASLYELVADASRIWQTKEGMGIVAEYMANIYDIQKKNPNLAKTYDIWMKKTAMWLENYRIPLDCYKYLYEEIQKIFANKPVSVQRICKGNLNLRLSDTLNDLEKTKGSLTRVKPAKQPIVVPESVKRCSVEQQKSIMSDEPLILTQAGAGTGKSTTILARIDWAIACGINANDIMVLSFTNAAANNILDRNPNVHSMTIAGMIHTIYSANFGHALSTIETIINVLGIRYVDDPVGMELQKMLLLLLKDVNMGFTMLNDFIENNLNRVIEILNDINQVSLEMEIILCYQLIGSLTEPESIQSKYLIIDEVQDNSVFEFIYLLKYINKHKESLYMVGDCSQTLYEFRASNPRALNILEGSGVFKTFQLNINYRSNQEVLDFANVTLANIEANQYAKIQLRANDRKPVTEKSFTDAVSIIYKHCKSKELENALSTVINSDAKRFLDAKLAKKEQVAFLAYTRRHVNMAEEMLKKAYPNASVVNIVPQKTYSTTTFSKFIKNYWDEVRFAPTTAITAIIAQKVMEKLQFLEFNPEKATPIIQAFLARWRAENNAMIASWQTQYINGHLTEEEFRKAVMNNMLAFEIKHNAMKQHLTANRNEMNKKQDMIKNADFIVSTIHSAKGLEFDNTLVLYHDKSLAEDEKRMYYVALTRAKRAECIFAYGANAYPKILDDYDTIRGHLHEIAPDPNSTFVPKDGKKTKNTTVKIKPNVTVIDKKDVKATTKETDAKEKDGKKDENSGKSGSRLATKAKARPVHARSFYPETIREKRMRLSSPKDHLGHVLSMRKNPKPSVKMAGVVI